MMIDSGCENAKGWRGSFFSRVLCRSARSCFMVAVRLRTSNAGRKYAAPETSRSILKRRVVNSSDAALISARACVLFATGLRKRYS